MPALTWAAAVILMVAAFALLRSRLAIFNAICAVVFAGAVSTWNDGRTADAAAAAAGFVLLWTGLLFGRAMLNRSVSLRMLDGYRGGAPAPAVQVHIASRIDDAERYGFIRVRGSACHLTAVGRALMRSLSIFYRLSERPSSWSR